MQLFLKKNIFQQYIRVDKREMYNSYQNYLHLQGLI